MAEDLEAQYERLSEKERNTRRLETVQNRIKEIKKDLNKNSRLNTQQRQDRLAELSRLQAEQSDLARGPKISDAEREQLARISTEVMAARRAGQRPGSAFAPLGGVSQRTSGQAASNDAATPTSTPTSKPAAARTLGPPAPGVADRLAGRSVSFTVTGQTGAQAEKGGLKLTKDGEVVRTGAEVKKTDAPTLTGPWTGQAAVSRVGSMSSDQTSRLQRVSSRLSKYGWSQAEQANRDRLKNILMGNAVGSGVPFMVADEAQGQIVNPGFADVKFGPKDFTRSWDPAQYPADRNISIFEGASLGTIYEIFMSFNPDELRGFQKELLEAGMYDLNSSPNDRRPRLGSRDQATREAMENLLHIWGSDIERPLHEVLSELKRDKNSRLSEDAAKLFGKDGAGGGGSGSKVQIQISSKETLGAMIDEVAVELFGAGINSEQKAAMIARLQEKEKAQKMAMGREQWTAEGGGGNREIDRFVNALIGAESGGVTDAVNPYSGAYGLGQIMPENWHSWATDAGVDPSKQDAATQMQVIYDRVAKYYAATGSWEDVAALWYSGHKLGQLNSWERNRPQANNHPSIQQYVDEMMSKMRGSLSASLAAGASGPDFSVYEQFNPAAAAAEELRAADPSRYYSTQFRRNAEVYFDLLNGLRRR